jgi:hypothetical protein
MTEIHFLLIQVPLFGPIPASARELDRSVGPGWDQRTTITPR